MILWWCGSVWITRAPGRIISYWPGTSLVFRGRRESWRRRRYRYRSPTARLRSYRSWFHSSGSQRSRSRSSRHRDPSPAAFLKIPRVIDACHRRTGWTSAKLLPGRVHSLTRGSSIYPMGLFFFQSDTYSRSIRSICSLPWSGLSWSGSSHSQSTRHSQNSWSWRWPPSWSRNSRSGSRAWWIRSAILICTCSWSVFWGWRGYTDFSTWPRDFTASGDTSRNRTICKGRVRKGLF